MPEDKAFFAFHNTCDTTKIMAINMNVDNTNKTGIRLTGFLFKER